MNGFTTLQSLARRFNENEIVASLEQSKRYLKTRYQIHCSESQTQITSHCAKFALSDPTDKRLISETDVSEEVCPECFELCKTIQKVEDIAKENCVDDDTMYDLKMAISDIFNYIKHLMRDSQQKQAKIEAFEKLDHETGFLVKRFLPKNSTSKI